MQVADVTELNLLAVHHFLEANADTTLFLQGNLGEHGPRLGDALNSGNFKCVLAAGKVSGVFCLTRRGNLLAETGGRTEFADAIVESCAADAIPIRGVVGEWRIANALWQILCRAPGFQEDFRSKERLYRLDLAGTADPAAESDPHGARVVRRLTPEDFDQYEPLGTAYLEEEGLPQQLSRQQQHDAFTSKAGAGHWWGHFEDGSLVAMAALNAVYNGVGQVGGVYTVPDRRRRGLARAVMKALHDDSVCDHALRRLVLFTGEGALPARRLYESLGYQHVGEFGLFFGKVEELKS